LTLGFVELMKFGRALVDGVARASSFIETQTVAPVTNEARVCPTA
jgi:hypothetical protein